MIQILEKHIADKISAGEVVDRPLSVVKELIENAIDARADAITVETKNGGKTYIRVTDNGCGIQANQTRIAFKRHATSKIKAASDLEQIQTLGFRGEALASISAVSRTEMVTKTISEKTGCKLVVEGSEIAEESSIGCPEGTTVIVRDLFYNTPARLKFMKSDAAESSLIIEFVSQMALAYPGLKIKLINNGNMLFSTRGNGDRRQTILTVYNKELETDLVPVSAEEEYLRLEGYVSGQGVSRPNRKSQIFFVNGRVVNSKLFERSISEAYSDKLFEGRHPIAYLFLNSAPNHLDVNIHPNKREVRFNDGKFVRDFISSSVQEALLNKEAIPLVKEVVFEKKKKEDRHSDSTSDREKNSEEGQQVEIKTLLSTIRKSEETFSPNTNVTAVREETQEYVQQPFDFQDLTVTASVFDTYILATDSSCVYFIDQHAAHERILFERLMKQYSDKEKYSQPMITPITVQVSHSVKERQSEWVDTLKKMGFFIEEFGSKTYVVKEIPVFMGLQEAEQFLEDYIAQIRDDIHLENQPVIEKIIRNSCKNAVKAQEHLSNDEITSLLDDLAQCKNPFSCPHGRPTFVRFTKHQLEKMFKRVQ